MQAPLEILSSQFYKYYLYTENFPIWIYNLTAVFPQK